MIYKPFVAAICVLLAATTLSAQTPQKVGIINLQQAMLGTKEGQKAAQELTTKFDPKRKELEGKQGDIKQKQQALAAASNTMAEEARTKMTREIDGLTKGFQREVEDYQSIFDAEQQKTLGELLNKMDVVVKRYAKDNNITLVLDVSQQVNVVYFSDSADITQDVIALYDRSASGPVSTTAPPAAAPKRATAPPAKP